MAAITTTGTLTAGNSRTFDLGPGSALTLTLLPNCRVTVTETPETVSASDAGGNSPRTHNHQLAGVFTYGPYAMGGTVVVDNAANSGSTVTWGRKDTTVSTSSDGLSLVSGDEIFPFRKLTARFCYTGIGDSIMSYGDSTNAGGAVAGPTSQNMQMWGSNLWGNVPLYCTANRAVGGGTIDSTISDQVAAAMADDSDIIWIHAGVNNLNPSIDATAPTVAVILERMRRLLTLVATKPVVILDAITPLASDSISGAFPRRTDIPLVNAGFSDLASEFPNVVFNDVYTPLAQDADSGLALANMTVAADGIHLTTRGAYTAGVATKATLERAQMAIRPLHRPTSMFLLPEIAGSGGTKTASTGTINGTVAANCQVQIVTNATGVVVTASVGTARANSQRLRIQNGNASASVLRFRLAAYTGYLTGLADGDTVRASSYLDLVSQSGLLRHDFAILQNPSGTNATFPSLQKSAQETTPLFPDVPYTVKQTAFGVLTATPLSMDFLWTLEVAAGGDVTLDMYGWTAEEVVAY